MICSPLQLLTAIGHSHSHAFHVIFGDPILQTVQQRGAAVIKARKLSSAMSAAKAICDHMRDIWSGTSEVNTIFISPVVMVLEELPLFMFGQVVVTLLSTTTIILTFVGNTVWFFVRVSLSLWVCTPVGTPMASQRTLSTHSRSRSR